MSSFEESIEQVTGRFARKRKREPSEWKKNKDKARKCASDGSKPQVSCKHNDGRCKASDLQSVDYERFHKLFYDLTSKAEQDSFITNALLVTKMARNRGSDPGRRQFSVSYYIQTCEGSKVKVCCATFCSILRIDPKRVQRLAAFYFSNGYARGENRGGKRLNERTETIKLLIRDHIQKFKCSSGHYNREKTPNRKYLPSELSVRTMWKMFQDTHADNEEVKSCNYHLYYKIFTLELNLGFGTPRADVCSYCEERNQRLKTETDDEVKKNLVCELLVHKKRAKQFYHLMKEPLDENSACFVFDMMQNQPLPRTSIGEAFYARQIWQYYIGIVRHYGPKSKQTNEDVTFYTWTESEAKRDSSVVSSAVFSHLENFCKSNRNIKKINLFCDGCSAQNKNYVLLSVLSKLSTQYKVIFNITYPVRGHSYLPVDRVFGRVEKLIRKTEQLLLPEDYNNIFKQVGQVKVLGRDWQVFGWKSALNSCIKSKLDFKISEMKVIKVSDKNVSCKAHYSDIVDMCTHTLLKRGKKWSCLIPEQLQLANSIKKEKLDDVQSLLNKLGVTDQHPAMLFYKKVFSSGSE